MKASEQGNPGNSAANRRDRTALVVENVLLFRQMIGRTLIARGIASRVLEAGTLAESRALWTPGGFQFIVADIHLPDGSAFEFLRRVQEEEPALPILVVSGRLDAACIREVLDLGVSGFLSKQENLDTFVTALQAVADGQRYFSPEIMDRLIAQREEEAGTLASLTPRELEVARLVADGSSLKESADVLGISPETVKVHRHRILRKMGLSNSHALARMLKHEASNPD